jgi:hypothetical protein
VPPLASEELARAIVRGLAERTHVLDMPRSLSVLYTLFDFAPGALRWLLRQGGGARSDFSQPPVRKSA